MFTIPIAISGWVGTIMVIQVIKLVVALFQVGFTLEAVVWKITVEQATGSSLILAVRSTKVPQVNMILAKEPSQAKLPADGQAAMVIIIRSLG